MPTGFFHSVNLADVKKVGVIKLDLSLTFGWPKECTCSYFGLFRCSAQTQQIGFAFLMELALDVLASKKWQEENLADEGYIHVVFFASILDPRFWLGSTARVFPSSPDNPHH